MSTHGRGRSLGVAALVTIAASTFAGCATSGAPEDAAIKNQAEWTMPLNEFFVYSPELDNYAEQLLISTCIESRGYEWPVPWQDTEYPQPQDFNSIGFRLFTVEIAKKWGYDFAPPANEESARLWREFVEVTDSYFPNAELDQALLDCTDEVRSIDTEFMSNFDGVNYLSSLAVQADRIALQDESVIRATAEWRECLEPQVDFPLPDNPREGMPPVEARKNWGSNADGASPAEIADAVADAECRESSGLTEAAYERNWEEQEKLVAKNRDKLERIRAEAVERKKMLLTIVAENAPEAP